LQWPEPQKRLLPRAFDVVGDIVLIRIPPEFSSEAGRIGRALLEFVPGARLVGWDRGVHGEFRQREIVPIAGDGAFRTLHRENGLILEVDLTEAYFSPRLSREHARVSAAIAEPERVLDLCCGVGPFTMAIADGGKAREVEAVDSNPAAIQLLELNRARITTRTVIRSAVASLESFLPSAKPGERAILNLPREGIKYLPQVARLLKPGGWLHYYEVSDRSAWERRPAELCELLGYATDRAWTVRYQHVVHPYSPIQDLVAYDLEQSGGTGAR
jgi:tRNA (guanine37-N1)-methyltransferase